MTEENNIVKEFISEYDAARILFRAKAEGGLSTRGAKRVLLALLEYPLNQSQPVFPNALETELYTIGSQMQKMKSLIIAESFGVKFNKKGEVHGEEETVSDSGLDSKEQTGREREGELHQHQ